MLAVAVSAALRRSDKDEQQGEEETTENSSKYYDDELLGDHELSVSLSPQGGFLLESISFDDLFAGIDDVLPDLEMDPADLFPPHFSSLTSTTGPHDHHNNNNTSAIISMPPDDGGSNNKSASSPSSSSSDSDSGGSISKGDEITVVMSKRDDDEESLLLNPSPTNDNNHNKEISEKGRKSSSSKSPPTQGKKKVKKVDWTPELHRRFVQAVEQLGVDKAVPSRILEVMGIHCLTRHNIASHLQKYRSHRKHLLAREAEAASWSQRRQMLQQGKRSEGSPPWVAPTIGFPPMPMPMPMPMPHFRPSLHVWGHPTPIDHQPLLHIWPKPNSPSPPPAWAPPPPNSDPSFWHHPRGPNALSPTPGAACYPRPPLTTTRFGCPTPTTTTTVAAPTAGVPPAPHAMYKLVDPGIALPARQPPPPPLSDFHPSKESVDAAIGDVLSKPWLPLPLGLKAPAIESVMGELQRQGIPKVPPSCA